MTRILISTFILNLKLQKSAVCLLVGYFRNTNVVYHGHNESCEATERVTDKKFRIAKENALIQFLFPNNILIMDQV